MIAIAESLTFFARELRLPVFEDLPSVRLQGAKAAKA